MITVILKYDFYHVKKTNFIKKSSLANRRFIVARKTAYGNFFDRNENRLDLTKKLFWELLFGIEIIF